MARAPSRYLFSVFIFWIVVKTGRLCLPVAGVRQRLIRWVGFPENRVEDAIRPKRREFAAHFVTSEIIPDTAWFAIGEKPPHGRDFSVSRWTGGAG